MISFRATGTTRTTTTIYGGSGTTSLRRTTEPGATAASRSSSSSSTNARSSSSRGNYNTTDADLAARAMQHFARIDATRNYSVRDNHLRNLWARAKIMMQQHGVTNPAAGFSFIKEFQGVCESTLATYASIIVKLHPEDFPDKHDVERILGNLERDKNCADKDQAAPATPEQVQRLIGDMSTPHQHCVFRLWTTVSRRADQRGFRVTLPPPGAFPAIRILVQFCKTNPTGSHPQHKWTYLHNEDERAWWTLQPETMSEESYWDSLGWLKSLEPTLSWHSFRRGALQFLEERFYNSHQTSLLTHHRVSRGQSVRGVTTYADPASLADPSLATVLEMSELLRQAVLPTAQPAPAPSRAPRRK